MLTKLRSTIFRSNLRSGDLYNHIYDISSRTRFSFALLLTNQLSKQEKAQFNGQAAICMWNDTRCLTENLWLSNCGKNKARCMQNLVLPPNFLLDIIIIVESTHNLRQGDQPKCSNAGIPHAVNYMLKQYTKPWIRYEQDVYINIRRTGTNSIILC